MTDAGGEASAVGLTNGREPGGYFPPDMKLTNRGAHRLLI